MLFLCGCAVSVFAQTIGWFVAGRVLQGAGITAASVLMRAIASDRFAGARLAQVLTWMVIAWGLGPIVAPALGAALQTSVGWRYALVFLMVYALALLAVVATLMPESNRSPQRWSARALARAAVEVYSTPRFALIFTSMGLCYGALLAFNLVAPFTIQTAMGHGPKAFAAVALALGAVYFAGVFSNRLLPKSIGTGRKFAFASTLALAAAALQLALAVAFDLNLWALVLPFACVVFCCGLIYPNLMALGVAAFPQLAGLASSLLGFALMLVSSAVLAAAALLDAHSTLPFAWLTLGLMGAVFVLLRALRV